MEITKGTDVILVLNEMRDVEGNPLFIKDCDKFKIKVWTSNKDCHLVYYGRDIVVEHIPHVDRHHPHYEHSDGTHPSHHHHHHIQKLRIAARDMNCLASGVIQYSFDYHKPDGTGGHDIKTIVTDLYWRNTNFHEEPCNPINYFSIEELRDKIEAESLQREKDIADIQNYIDNDFTNGLGDEIERSTAKDEEHDEAIAANAAAIEAEVERATAAEQEIIDQINGNADEQSAKLDTVDNKLSDEILRATNKEAELATAINDEAIRAKAEEARIELKIDNEIARATTKEGVLSDALDSEKTRATAAETVLTNSLAAANAQIQANVTAITNEVQRATAKDGEIETNLTTEINRAKGEESRIEGLVNSAKSDVATIREDVNDNADAIQDEITRSTNKDAELNTAITAEVTRAKGEESRIEGKIDTVDTKVDGEIARAKAAEQSIDAKATANATEIATIKTNLATASNNVTAEVSRAQGEESRIEGKIDADKTELNAAISAVDAKADAIAAAIEAEANRAKGIEGDLTTQLTTLKTSYLATKGIAESNQTAVTTLNGDANVIGSVAHALADSKHYTDEQIAAAQTANNGNYYTKAQVDGKIADLIDGAPSTLDTLKELADAMNNNADAIAAIDSIAGQKADKADVYTKAQIDAKETTLNASIAAEVTRATAAENAISTIANQANDVAAQAQTTANANATAITTANTTIAAHTAALGVINGDDTVIGSIEHALRDAKHYTDDKVADVESKIPTKVSELENDLNYVKLSETSVVKDQNDNVINELWIDNSELDDTIEVYTKAQCDARFAPKGAATGNVDLSNYYNKSQVDNKVAAKANSADVYTKSQVDAKIPDLTNYVEKDGAKVLSDNNYTTAEKNKLAAVPSFWQGTQAQYDAIATKNNNTIYIVL